jgi:citrate lyase gamma subunit
MVVRRSDESRIRASILPDDERAHIRERLAELESDVAQQIKAYDENLSDLEVRAQIEQQFGAQSDEIKQLAMKLAKDELARGKLQSMN